MSLYSFRQNVWERQNGAFRSDTAALLPLFADAKRLERSLGTLGGGNHFIESRSGGRLHLLSVIHFAAVIWQNKWLRVYQQSAIDLHMGKRHLPTFSSISATTRSTIIGVFSVLIDSKQFCKSSFCLLTFILWLIRILFLFKYFFGKESTSCVRKSILVIRFSPCRRRSSSNFFLQMP